MRTTEWLIVAFGIRNHVFLNNTGQLKKRLSRRLALGGSWHNNCVLSQTRAKLRLCFLSTRSRQGRWCLPFFMAIGIGLYLLAILFVRIQFAPNHLKGGWGQRMLVRNFHSKEKATWLCGAVNVVGGSRRAFV